MPRVTRSAGPTPQLAAIRNDPHFAGGDYYGGTWPFAGMAVARQIAHLTYRSEHELNTRFGREAQSGEDLWSGGRYAVQSYLAYHGAKLGRRFDPNSYLVLTEAMNSHDIGRGRGGLQAALDRITAELTVAVVNTDRLFPPHLGRELAAAPTARPLVAMRSDYGHDGFLIEAEQVAALVFSAVASIREHGCTRRDRRAPPVGDRWARRGYPATGRRPAVVGWTDAIALGIQGVRGAVRLQPSCSASGCSRRSAASTRCSSPTTSSRGVTTAAMRRPRCPGWARSAPAPSGW